MELYEEQNPLTLPAISLPSELEILALDGATIKVLESTEPSSGERKEIVILYGDGGGCRNDICC